MRMVERGDRPRRARSYSGRSHRSRYPDIYVIRDTAALQQDGKPLPGVAQVAIQQGQYAGRRIAQSLLGKPSSTPFRYFDRGNMAVVGAGFAVLQARRFRLSGIVAWLAWAGIHLQFLATSGLRLSVLLQWIWSFVTRQTGVRLIVNHKAAANPGGVWGLSGDPPHHPSSREGR